MHPRTDPLTWSLDVFDAKLADAIRFAHPDTVARYFPSKVERVKAAHESKQQEKRLLKLGIVRPFALKR